MNRFIVCAGNIGVGKSTLARALSALLGWALFKEPVETNVYLSDFYANPSRHAFAMQVYLLTQRFRLHQEIIWRGKGAVQDRSIYEDTIFAEMLRDDGIMEERDFAAYLDLFLLMSNFLQRPGVIVFLDATPEECLERVRERRRPCEANLTLDYLQKLDRAYRRWVKANEERFNILTVPWHDGDRNPQRALVAIQQRLDVGFDADGRWGRHLT